MILATIKAKSLMQGQIYVQNSTIIYVCQGYQGKSGLNTNYRYQI